ncbi:MAG: cysteine hydrolase [Planctomycetes bacterium]|nr:cysteine hydrolase [Planctomycetota bacterium]
MITPSRRAMVDHILVDLNTQCDFLLPGGALPVANRAEVLPRVRQIMNWARLKQIPVISSLEAHRPGESFRNMPPHCLDRTLGQKKLPFTLMPNRMLIMGDNTADVPMDPFRRIQQLIFTKRHPDFLANPKADRLINSLTANYWILFGVSATHCVKAVTLGLLGRHNKVVVARDACGYWSVADGEHAFRQMEAKGAMIATTDEIVSGAVDDKIKSHLVQFDTDDELDTLGEIRAMSLEEEHHAEKPACGNGSNGNGHRHNGANGYGSKSNGAKQDPVAELRPENVADFVPPHLIREKARHNGKKARRDLA